MLDQKQLDAYFGRSCRGMALTDFTYLLSLVSDTLTGFNGLSISQLICFVHLSALLLREHPSRRNRMVIPFYFPPLIPPALVRYFGSHSEVRDAVY